MPYAANWRAANAAAIAGSDPLWVALGDSMTLGVGASAYDRGWVGQLAARFAAAGQRYGVVNLGISGARTSHVLERQLPALADLEPDLVTLMIGSNDLLRPRYRSGLVERFAEILQRLPAGTVVTTLPNPSRTAAAVNDLLERAARSRNLVLAELRDPRTTSWRGKLAADHFHPNDRGYAALADVVGEAAANRR